MRAPRSGLLNPVFVSSLLVLFLVPIAFAASDDDTRDVRLGIVQGDVRLSRGNHGRSDLKRPWEEALAGGPLSQGFAISTGNGRASIDFEDGSTVYIAEDSLLVLREISTVNYQNYSEMVLVVGSATFSLKPAADENYVVSTFEDRISVSSPRSFYGRLDAYFDATAISPQAAEGVLMNRDGAADFRIWKGQSIFMSGGEIAGIQGNSPQSGQDGKCFESLRQGESLPGFSDSLSNCFYLLLLRKSGLLEHDSSALPVRHFEGASAVQTTAKLEWDGWVDGLVTRKKALVSAALKSSGLSAPIPDLVELYQNGTFLQCAPYGTCWEPKEPEFDDISGVASPAQNLSTTSASTQNPQAGAAPNQTFQPVTVYIYQRTGRRITFGTCALDDWVRVPYVANSSAELQILLLRQRLAAKAQSTSFLYGSDCFNHTHIFQHNHYVRVLSPSKSVCNPHHMHCKKHPNFPHNVIPVRVNGKLGFVPRHPDDKKGKPPLNLKNGILFLPEKPGQPVQRVAFDPSQRIKFESKLPSEFQRELTLRPSAEVSAPEIRAHLMSEAFHGYTPSGTSANSHGPQIAFDYKSQKFLMSGESLGEKNARPVAVAGLSGNKISSFAGSYSSHSGGSFDRSGSSSGRGSSYSGGGHNSGSASSGSHSGGSSSSGSSHSYSGGGSSSSSSGGSHYSGGSSSSSSSSSSSGSSGSTGSSSSSSSSGSSSSGGRPH